MRPALARLRILVPTALLVAATSASAQVLDLTVNNTGLAIGDKPRVNGVRINFRDRRLEEVNGVNITIWNPYQPATGVVNGLALGIPVTGAKDINGIATGVFGAGADHSLRGIGIAPIGLGSGGEMHGIMLGGIGVGAGGALTGLAVGGIGVGSGGEVQGIAIGGIGVGGGSSFTGIGIGGVGVGSGGDATGLMIGGVGVGSGGTLRGLAIGGIGAGAPNVQGVILSPIAAGGQHVHAIVIPGAYFKVERDGPFDGGSLSAFNHIKGAQHGLTIGLFNYARELHGAQIGVINVSDNGGHRRVIPILGAR